LQTQIESHLNLALRGLEATQHQVYELVTVVKDQSIQMERQSQEIEGQSQHIKRQSQQIERQSGQIERLISKDKEQSQQIERQSGQIERLISKEKEQSEKMERLMSTVQVQPAHRVGRGPINQNFQTTFEWKIPHIKQMIVRSMSGPECLVSEPFYLFRRGYKYFVKINIARQFLSVFIKVVPGGAFDESLSWPCKEKVRVTLVDQDPVLDNRKSISHVIDFDEDEEPCSRPLRRDFHEYRPILALINLHFPVGSYLIKNDTILISVNRE